MLRTPILACFGLFIGFSAFACATSAAPDIGDIIAERNATDPADAGGTVVGDTDTSSTNTSSTGPVAPVATVTKPVAPPPVVFDAGARGVDAGTGDDDDDTTGGGGKNCPQTDQYQEEAVAEALIGAGTSCAKGPSACAADECCVVNALSSTANLCVPK